MKSKVVLLPCREYDEEKIYTLLKQGLDFLGGLENLIPKDAKILLKPNLLKKAEVEKAVITHPVVVGAFARILRENGYEHIVLADSCGHGTTQAVIRGTGMDMYLEKYHIPAIDYSEGVKTVYPQGIQAKEFILPKELLEQDCVISLSKMKTHALERITGAVKNSYGFIYGFHKAKGHTQYPSADSFARMLIDLNKCVAPKLYVIDGILAMEGNGPGSGDPVPMNVLLMSTDPVALDSVFSRLVYLKPEMVPTNYHGEKMGLGTWKEEEIALLTPDGKISMAEAVKKYGNPDFHVDRTEVRKNIWTRMAGALKVFQKKPYIDADKCVRCGICVQSCPVPGKAVDFRKGKGKLPVYDYRKCIRCFCCQEMCPKKAIKVK
ncbi:DUF362 domain-containing protein [Blautia luti]|jgi:uncharacterized protein (DUF362 family)/NAD-dependent dihydropyrimidine dehydrogenase PreA subunit|uniref:Ferredoxin n=1 Tax=Blautia luti DSM 14534 = JCM 17040 TaxID=649762 RepID=A0A844GIK3_9FIRM|nr:DUF362 domain-containing protein [Blautia luti]MTD60531.1 DUF362 domain-containing protein [Blautia luti DSM 14534 = JCM 17040]BEI61009.1 DUF362 domain-containing protein [Blautia luti]